MQQVIDLLHTAANRIERGGWCRGVEREGSAQCLEAALRSAEAAARGTYGPNEASRIHACAYCEMQDYLGTDEELYKWNDAGGRRASDVIAALRNCAGRLSVRTGETKQRAASFVRSLLDTMVIAAQPVYFGVDYGNPVTAVTPQPRAILALSS